MADNIRTYTASDRTLHPDEKGFAAFETAGRRIPAAYNEAAQAYRDIGRLQAREIEDRKWPLDILDLRARTAVRIRFRKDSGFAEPQFPDISRENAEASQELNRLAMGAGALGDYLSKTADAGGGELIDVGSGTTSFGRKTVAGTGPDLLGPGGGGGNPYDPGLALNPLGNEISQQIAGGMRSARGGDIGFQEIGPPGMIGAPGTIGGVGDVGIGSLPGGTVVRGSAPDSGGPSDYITEYAPAAVLPGGDYGGGGDDGGFFSGLWSNLTGAAGAVGDFFTGGTDTGEY